MNEYSPTAPQSTPTPVYNRVARNSSIPFPLILSVSVSLLVCMSFSLSLSVRFSSDVQSQTLATLLYCSLAPPIDVTANEATTTSTNPDRGAAVR